MPSTSHEAPLELLRQNPLLAAVLLRQAGVELAEDVTAGPGPTDLSVVTTKQYLADNLTVLYGPDGQPVWVTVNEPQREPDESKLWTWPVYLTVARSRSRCPATLLAFCYDKRTANWARQPIETGHPDFVLRPVVIDASNTPDPADPAFATVAPELVVLAAHTGALDLDDPAARELAATKLIPIDAERAELYTSLILDLASVSARAALEGLMARTDFKIYPAATRFAASIAKLKEQAMTEGRAEGQAAGRAEGEAEMLLRIVAKRGIEVAEETRNRVLACTDIGTIESWSDRVLSGGTAEEIFGD